MELLQAKGIEVVTSNIEKEYIPLPDCSVHIVIANNIVEDTKELLIIVHNFLSRLKGGGQIIIGVPNLAPLYNQIARVFGRQPTCIRKNSSHIRGLTKSGVRQIRDV